MTARLARIALISFAISAVCLITAAWLSKTPWFGAHARPWMIGQSCWAMPVMRLLTDDNESASGDAKPVSIPLAWDGNDAIDVKIAAKIFYQPGPKPEAIVTGDPELIRHVYLQGGALRWDANVVNCGPAREIVVRFIGPAVTSWKMTGAGQLTLSALDQDRLDIKLTGSSRVAASGNVQRVSLDITGSAKADLGKLVTQRASARITGSGDADLTVSDEADLRITGSGSVTLHGQPKQVQSHVSGSGKIRNMP